MTNQFTFAELAVLLVIAIGNFTPSSLGNNQSPQSSALDTLELVQILHRHGKKNPEYPYGNDPYSDEDFWPGGWVQLTDEGISQAYELGTFLRKRYRNFIGEKYNQYEIYVLSSDTERSIRTALANLDGLYSVVDFANGQNLSSASMNPFPYPIPIRTMLRHEDRIIGVSKVCPKFRDDYDDFLKNSDVLKPVYEENKDLFDYINHNSGMNITVFNKDFGNLHDVITFEDQMGYTLPNWTLPLLNSQRMIDLIAFSISLKAYNLEFQRFSVGSLLQLIRDNIKANTDNLNSTEFSDISAIPKMHDSRRKMVVFSGHDTIMVYLMKALEVYENIRPPFASALMLELHRNRTTGRRYLELWYRNDTSRKPYLLPLSKNNDMKSVSLEEFLRNIEPIIPENWDNECRKSDSLTMVQSNVEVTGISGRSGIPEFLIGVFLGGLVVILCSVVFKYYDKTRLSQSQPQLSKNDYIGLD